MSDELDVLDAGDVLQGLGVDVLATGRRLRRVGGVFFQQ
jgi:hypothetical protein